MYFEKHLESRRHSHLIRLIYLLVVFPLGRSESTRGIIGSVSSAASTAVNTATTVAQNILSPQQSDPEFVFARAGADQYHSSQPELVAAKQRLLAFPNLTVTPTDQMSIRAHSQNQSVAAADAITELQATKDLATLVQGGLTNITPLVTGTTQVYQQALDALSQYYLMLSGNKTATDSLIANFAVNNDQELRKHIATLPDTQSATFKQYNMNVQGMFNVLDKNVNKQTDMFNNFGTTTFTKYVKSMAGTNKTLDAVSKQMSKFDQSFTSNLTNHIVPQMSGAKLNLAGNVALLQKAKLDAIDNLNSNAIPSVQASGTQYMSDGGSKLLAKTQSLSASATQQAQSTITQVQAKLKSMASSNAYQFKQNVTQMANDLSNGAITVAQNRAKGDQQIQKAIDAGVQVETEFKQNILQTASDLQNILSTSEAQLNAATQSTSMDSQSMGSQYQSKIAGLFSSSSQMNGLQSNSKNNQQILNIENVIANMHASGSDGTGKFSTNVQSKINQALTDSANDAATAASQLGSISDSASQIVGPQLDAQTGVANSNIASMGQSAVGKVGDLASNIQAQIDESQANQDDDQASVVSSFQKGISAKDNVLSQLSDLSGKINSQQAQLSDQANAAAGAFVNGVSDARNQLGSQQNQLSGIQATLAQYGQQFIPAMDADNENRINSAFTQLNQLRRLTSSAGDAFSSNGNALINQAVAGVSNSSTNYLSQVSTSDLSTQIQGIQASSAALQQNLTQFQFQLNDQLQATQDLFTDATNAGGVNGTLAQLAAQAQNVVTDGGRNLIQQIYNIGMANSSSPLLRILKTNPKFNVAQFLGDLLNTTIQVDLVFAPAQTQVSNLNKASAQTVNGLKTFYSYLSSVRNQVAQKWAPILNDSNNIQNLLNTRTQAIADIVAAKQTLNDTIQDGLQSVEEVVSNKTYNYYNEWQTAAVIADSLVQGFSDYIDKMISYENVTAQERLATQAQILKTIQDNANSSSLVGSIEQGMNSTQLAKLNELIALASDSTNSSQAAMDARNQANAQLVALYGQNAASAMETKYQGLQANAQALTDDLQSSYSQYTSDRVGSLVGAQLGASGINSMSGIFSNQSDEAIAAQKTNANELASQINDLFDKSGFLRNITGQELGEILKNVQQGDQLHYNQWENVNSNSRAQVANMADTVGDFAVLAAENINRTRDFLDSLTKNYTALMAQFDAIATDPVDAVKTQMTNLKNNADSVNQTLSAQLASIEPLEEGITDRLSSIESSENDFGEKIQNQLTSFTNEIHNQQGDIAVYRQKGLQKLQTAISQMLEDFRSSAVQYQSEAVDGASASVSSLLQTGSDQEIRNDMIGRISAIKKYLRT